MAANTFTVSHGAIRLRVRLLPTIKDVHKAFRKGRSCRLSAGSIVNAYFHPTTITPAKYTGAIVLPEDGKLIELVPHEVTHAVIHALGGVLPRDDETAATSIGILCARIFKRIEQTGVAI